MKFKNWSLSVMFLLVLSLVLVACSDNGDGEGDGGTSDSGNESVTISAIFPSGDGGEETIKALTEQFESEHDIKVDLEFVAYNSLKQKILTSAKTGDYDVTMVDLPWLAQFANADILQEIPEGLSEEEESDIFESILEGVMYNDKMYAMPWKNDTKFLFYNKDMLEKAGFDSPPETWQELEEQAKKIKEEGIVNNPIVWSWSQSEALVCDYVVLLGGFGDDILVDGQPNFTSEKIEAATTFMVDSLENGLSNPNSTEYLEQDVLDNFINEESAFALNWSFMYHEVLDSDIADSLGVTVVPGSDDVETSSVYGGEGLGVTYGSENPDAALEYIKFITSKEVQNDNIDITLPIWKSLYTEESVLEQGPELVEVASKQFDHMLSRPKTPAYGNLSQSIQVEVQNILTGNSDVKSGLSKLEEEAKKLLSE